MRDDPSKTPGLISQLFTIIFMWFWVYLIATIDAVLYKLK